MASLDLYTQNIPLTQKAKFWTNFVSSLKGRDIEKLSLSRSTPLRALLTTDIFSSGHYTGRDGRYQRMRRI